MTEPAEGERPRRRTGGRSARVRESVLRAVLDTLTEGGPDAVTVNEVARRAGVHATSIQRRWGTREKLVLDAMLEYSRAQVRAPDSGTLHGDLVAFVQSLAGYLDTSLGQTLVKTMAVADDDDALAAARAAFWQSRFDAAAVVVERAIERGELPVGVDPALVLELATAPLHFRTLLTRQPIDRDLIERIVETVVRGVG